MQLIRSTKSISTFFFASFLSSRISFLRDDQLFFRTRSTYFSVFLFIDLFSFYFSLLAFVMVISKRFFFFNNLIRLSKTSLFYHTHLHINFVVHKEEIKFLNPTQNSLNKSLNFTYTFYFSNINFICNGRKFNINHIW